MGMTARELLQELANFDLDEEVLIVKKHTVTNETVVLGGVDDVLMRHVDDEDSSGFGTYKLTVSLAE